MRHAARHLPLAASALLLAAGSAGAQTGPDRLANFDTPEPAAPPREVRLSAETRLFGGKEDLAYSSLAVHYGLAGGDEVVLRYVGARRKAYDGGSGFRVRHGGSDLELMARLHLRAQPNYALLVGLTLPDTPAQGGDEPHASAQLVGRFPAGDSAALYASARVQAIDSNTLVGVGIGFSASLGPSLQLLGDVTAVVAGENTYDVATGRRERETALWGLSAQYLAPGADPRFRARVGVTNALGVTTGYSLTPGLDDSVGVVLGFGFRL